MTDSESAPGRDPETHVVVGAGLAAAKAVEAMRDVGFPGRIVVVGNERHRPYERPPLSKGYLMGQSPLEEAFVHPEDWYDEHDVELLLGETVTGIAADERLLVTASGTRLAYDRLLLATGAVPVPLAPAEAADVPVAYLRTIEDSDRLKDRLREGVRVVVVGGGWIGLEVAAAAREAGCEVTVIEALELPLLRVMGPEVARVFAELHREHGVTLRTGAGVTGVERAGDEVVVRLAEGGDVRADLLVAGIGVLPNSGIAEAAGIAVDNGVLVDEYLRTSDPSVFAAGDVANAWYPTLGARVRVEHWDTALNQGTTVGRTMAGEETAYDQLPYFFTDQYDLGMEYVGHVGSEGYDEVVLRGDVPGRVFSAFWLRDGRIVAGMHVNDWDAIDPVRAIVGVGRAGVGVDLGRLRDPAVPLGEVAPTHAP